MSSKTEVHAVLLQNLVFTVTSGKTHSYTLKPRSKSSFYSFFLYTLNLFKKINAKCFLI